MQFILLLQKAKGALHGLPSANEMFWSELAASALSLISPHRGLDWTRLDWNWKLELELEHWSTGALEHWSWFIVLPKELRSRCD